MTGFMKWLRKMPDITNQRLVWIDEKLTFPRGRAIGEAGSFPILCLPAVKLLSKLV